jgi:serine/threonine protein kinase/tetratricopeptide (TPR) repeat protein
MSQELPSPETIFAQAIEIAASEERAAFLGQACGNDAQLHDEVAKLVRDHFRAGAFLQQAAAGFAVRTEEYAASEHPGTVIGPYKLLEQIGEGGFGVVFMAEQTDPVRRKVALKILKPGMDTRQVVARFEAERQALALMDHPNIAKVLDGGQTSSGRPYFVMDLVKGLPITEYCDQAHLTPRERLELFVHLCQAVQHAHQKGVIHRDLKPSNVLVMVHDTTPVVKVIDFGVAKAQGQQLTDKTLFTGFAQMIGTPLYMSPEQAGQSGVDIDTRSDIYSLGVLLYELLTSTTPFDKDRLKEVGYDEMRRIIREEEPPRPSTRISTLGKAATTVSAQRKSDPRRLSQLFRGELDWIVMKCLEKDRNRRYETASALAADVQRYLNDEPVLACPPSAWYRFRKFARRNKRPLLAAGLVLVALVGGIIGTTWGMLRAKAAQQAETQRAEGERQAKQQALQREAETLAVLDFVENKIIAAARPRDQAGGQGYDVKLAEAIKAALPFVEKSFPDRPLIEARLRLTMGVSFLFLGDAKTASVQFQAARKLYTEHRGPDHPDTLLSMNYLALSYAAAGRTREAIELHEETLQLRKARLGPEHPDTLASMSGLANSYAAAGRLQEALKLREETLQLQKAKLGPDHPDTLVSMSNLATSYWTVGRTQEALKLHEETLQLRKATLGADHPDTLMSMNNLATSYWTVGRSQEALKFREETLQRCKATLGADHPYTLSSMHNLTTSYWAMGRTKEALKLCEETLQREKATLGPDHPNTLLSMMTLANAYYAAGRTQEALKVHEETLRLQKATLGPDHPNTLLSMMTLANAYYAAGRTQDAIKLHEETLRLRKATLGPDHPDTVASTNNLAVSYHAAGRTQEALKLHEETLRLQKATLGPDHPDTLASRINLTNSYAAAGRTQDALKLGEETLRLCKAKLGPDHPDTLTTMTDLANSYHAAGRTREALELREETLRLCKATLGPDHPRTLASVNNLANSYITAGQVAEAVAILKDTLTLRERRGKAEPGNNLEQSYLAWTHGQIGEAQQTGLDYAAAVQAYARSVEMFEKLHQTGALKDAHFAGRLNLYRQRLAQCRKAERAVKDLDFALQQPAADVPELLLIRLRYLLKEQKLPAAVESAARMKERAGDKAEHLYDAACAYALCAAAKQAKRPDAAVPGSEKLAEEAMAMLNQAVARGYQNAAHLKEDRDLDALRQRADFQKLLADLENAKKD